MSTSPGWQRHETAAEGEEAERRRAAYHEVMQATARVEGPDSARMGRLYSVLGEDELNLLGHSHGGVVAMAYAAAYPQRVRRLVVANSLARVLPESIETAVQLRSDEPWYGDAREALVRAPVRNSQKS